MKSTVFSLLLCLLALDPMLAAQAAGSTARDWENPARFWNQQGTGTRYVHSVPR